jgi:DNA polymerase-1
MEFEMTDSKYPSVALLDADILLYIASRGAEERIDWEDGEDPMVIEDFAKAKTIIMDHINAWHQMSYMDTYHLFFSDRENPCFRMGVYPIYKKHRDGYERPPLYDKLGDWLKVREQDRWTEYKYLEADDALGIWQTQSNQSGIKTCIVSIDKDMLTIPGLHLNPNDPNPALRTVTPDEADYNWMMQTLTGDRVDNYKGAPGIGPGRATKLLDPHYGSLKDMWGAVLEGYYDQWEKPNWEAKFQFGNPLEEAIANARCARILRHGDYDTDTNEVTLWNP